MTDAARVEAGPATDALVAERVMGWKRGEVNVGGNLFPRTSGAWLTKKAGGDGLFIGYYTDEWAPSLEVAHAWRVVEEMAALGWAMALDMEVHEGRPIYGVLFWDGNEFKGGADADTAPLAISRAALDALANSHPKSIPAVTEGVQESSRGGSVEP